MANGEKNAPKLDRREIGELGDWRGETLSKVRESHQGSGPRCSRGVEVGEAHQPRNTGLVAQRRYLYWRVLQERVKLTFFKGAALNDPSGLFNSSLDGKVRRAIDIKENDKIDEGAPEEARL